MQRRLLYPSLVPRCFSSVPPVRAGAAQCLLPQNSFASRALFCNAFLLFLIQSVIDRMKSVLSMAVPRSPCVSPPRAPPVVQSGACGDSPLTPTAASRRRRPGSERGGALFAQGRRALCSFSPRRPARALCDFVKQKNQHDEHGADLKVARGLWFCSGLL